MQRVPTAAAGGSSDIFGTRLSAPPGFDTAPAAPTYHDEYASSVQSRGAPRLVGGRIVKDAAPVEPETAFGPSGTRAQLISGKIVRDASAAPAAQPAFEPQGGRARLVNGKIVRDSSAAPAVAAPAAEYQSAAPITSAYRVAAPAPVIDSPPRVGHRGTGISASSNAFASGASQNTGNVLTDRPTIRVHAAPGGNTSFRLG